MITGIPTVAPAPTMETAKIIDIGKIITDSWQQSATNPLPHAQDNLFQATWDGWMQGWQHSAQLQFQWLSGGMIDILIMIALAGVFMNIAGLKKWGNRMILGSIMIGIISQAVIANV